LGKITRKMTSLDFGFHVGKPFVFSGPSVTTDDELIKTDVVRSMFSVTFAMPRLESRRHPHSTSPGLEKHPVVSTAQERHSSLN